MYTHIENINNEHFFPKTGAQNKFQSCSEWIISLYFIAAKNEFPNV